MKLLLVVWWLAAAPEPSRAETERPDTYTVQSGDSCATIAARFWGATSRIDELHRYNNLGPTPHRLVAGQVLRLRHPDPNTPDATLTFVKPAVRARKTAEWEPATLGMGLFRLNEVNTMRRAGAELTLRDQSQLLLDENALVVIYGEPNAQFVTRGPAIVEGEVRMALSGARAVELPGGGTLTATRADGVAAVDGARTSRVSIFDGDVVVESQKVAVRLKRDEGTVVRHGAPPLPPRPLPMPPELHDVAAVTGQDGVANVRVAWSAVPNAARYRVQLARDARFLDLAVNEMTSGESLELHRLSPGRYQLRVIAFDAEGLQGRAAEAKPLDVVSLGLGPDASGVVALRAGVTPRFVGPPGFSLSPAPQTLPAGQHQVEVRDGAGAVVSTVRVSVRPLAPTVRVEAGTTVLEFSEALDDASALSLRDAGGEVPLRQLTPRRFEVGRATSGPATLRWGSFDLLRFGRASGGEK